MAGLAIIALTGTPAAALAVDQRIVDNVKHFVECWGYMWTDEASHIEFCSPSRAAPVVWASPPGPFVFSVSPSAWTDSSPPYSEPSSSQSSEQPSSSSEESSEVPSSSEEPSSSELCGGEQCPPPCEGTGCEPV